MGKRPVDFTDDVNCVEIFPCPGRYLYHGIGEIQVHSRGEGGTKFIIAITLPFQARLCPSIIYSQSTVPGYLLRYRVSQNFKAIRDMQIPYIKKELKSPLTIFQSQQ